MRLIIKKSLLIAAAAVLTAAALSASFVFSEAAPDAQRYEVMGVDVSDYQGDIDWDILEAQGVRFAFIKATEGSGYTDASFQRNITSAEGSGIKTSAYHFFSFDSAGATQADNFIAAIGDAKLDMPPAVDIEYYGDKALHKPTREETREILGELLDRLEQHYGVKPVIYTTLPAYLRYVRRDFPDYPLWIRSVDAEPDLIGWTFWQYSGEGILDGYYGDEKYIDLNVYNGTKEEFEKEFLASDETEE